MTTILRSETIDLRGVVVLFMLPTGFVLTVLVVAHLFLFVWQQPKHRWLIID